MAPELKECFYSFEEIRYACNKSWKSITSARPFFSIDVVSLGTKMETLLA